METDTYVITAAGTNSDPDTPRTTTSPSSFHYTLGLIRSDDALDKLEAAREIRRLTKTSHRCRRQFSAAVEPLVGMLCVDSDELNEAALLALLNLAVKDELNKISIVEAGALDPIVKFLKSKTQNLQEHAAASLLTLSASSLNKPKITASGAVPHLVETLEKGSQQAKSDAVMALYNLSTNADSLNSILKSKPIPLLVKILNSSKKSSKVAAKCSALLESLVGFEEARSDLTATDGGVLAVVEVLENGSLQSREHAVGTLLTMCQSDRNKYRDPILKEGVIPGLLELTVQGTAKSQSNAQTLLRLLRDSPYPRSEIQADTLENIVCNIISQIDGEDQSGKAKQMLAEMVQVSMEQSLRHLQQRALCTPADITNNITTCASKVSSK